MRVPLLAGVLLAPFALFACATAVIPSDLGGEMIGSDAGGVRDSGYGGGRDTGSSPDDAGPDDTGTVSVRDTGTPVVDSGTTVVDSGSGALHGGDCTGTTSTQLTPTTYDNACDNYYFNVGTSNPIHLFSPSSGSAANSTPATRRSVS